MHTHGSSAQKRYCCFLIAIKRVFPMAMKYKIVVPSYNSVEWLPDCLQSLEDQKYKNYDVVVIDDASTDERQCEIIAQFTQRNGWKMLCNEQNQGTLANVM